MQFEERLFVAGTVSAFSLSCTIDDEVELFQFVDGNGDRISVVNPANKEQVASVHVAGLAEVNAAVEAAEKAWPAWDGSDPAFRAKVLNKLADLIEENAATLALAQTIEMGRPYTQSL